jgi:hypothetical protein
LLPMAAILTNSCRTACQSVRVQEATRAAEEVREVAAEAHAVLSFERRREAVCTHQHLESALQPRPRALAALPQQPCASCAGRERDHATNKKKNKKKSLHWGFTEIHGHQSTEGIKFDSRIDWRTSDQLREQSLLRKDQRQQCVRRRFEQLNRREVAQQLLQDLLQEVPQCSIWCTRVYDTRAPGGMRSKPDAGNMRWRSACYYPEQQQIDNGDEAPVHGTYRVECR